MRLFDLHSDTVWACWKEQKDLWENDLHISLKDGICFDSWIQTFAFFIADTYRGDAAYQHYLEMYKVFQAAYNERREVLEVYQNQKTLESHKCYAVLAVEGGAVLGGKIERIQQLHKMHISMLTLCWNGQNEIASGALSEGGLTSFGREVVRELERCNIIVDVSHLNRESFWDVCKIAEKPIVATHSNSNTIHEHLRNLTDEQIKEIIRQNGLIGINFYINFLSDEKNPPIETIIRHIAYILELGGEDALAIGSDFDGADMPSCMDNIKKIENLYKTVVEYMGNRVAEKLFFTNARNFFQRNLNYTGREADHVL